MVQTVIGCNMTVLRECTSTASGDEYMHRQKQDVIEMDRTGASSRDVSYYNLKRESKKCIDQKPDPTPVVSRPYKRRK